MAKARERRHKGEGSIYQTTVNGVEGIWVASFTVQGENGRRATVKGHGTSPEIAIERRAKNYAARIAGGGKKSSKKTLQDALKVWKEENTSVKENKKRVQRNIEMYILPKTKDTPMAELTPKRLNDIIRDLETNELPSVGRNVFRSLRGILQFSVKKGWISSNPLKQVREPYYKPKVSDDDELKATDRSKQFIEFLIWLEENNFQEYPFFLFMSLGLRIGELCGLETNSYTSKHELYIDRTFLTVPNRIEKRTKNKANRIVNIPVEYLGTIAQWEQLNRPEPKAGEWYSNQLFTYTNNRGEVKGTTTNRGRERWAQLNYEFLKSRGDVETYEEYIDKFHYRPHFNRHLTATNLAAAGIPTETAMKFLGHKDAKMTAYYQHTLEEQRSEAGTALVEAILTPHLQGSNKR